MMIPRCCRPQSMAVRLLVVGLLIFEIDPVSSFNFEISRRVVDAIEAFFGVPENMVLILKEYRTNGGFANNLQASDRDVFTAIAHSLRQVSHVDMIYFGSEQGVFMGYSIEGWGTYREPGNSGYGLFASEADSDGGADNATATLYRNTCIDRWSGAPATCSQQPYAPYIRCNATGNDCSALDLCPRKAEDVAAADTEEGTAVEALCYQYEIVEPTDSSRMLGFVPRTYHCQDEQGQFSQAPNQIVKPDGSLGDCLYADQTTRVYRNVLGNFAYCQQGGGNNDNQCRDTFVGGYQSVDYDPRYRDWYVKAKEQQRPFWSVPYPFFSSGKLGVTFSHPIYSDLDDDLKVLYDQPDAKIFQGVMGVDYTFTDLELFLNASYSTADTIVVIYERAAPHYLVASSTEFDAAMQVLKGTLDNPCPYQDDYEGRHCTIIRRSITAIDDTEKDGLLVRAAYQSQVDANYPRGLVSVKDYDDGGSNDGKTQRAYASQSSFYSAAGGKSLEWVILVISPVARSTTDAIKSEDSLFGVVCAIAGLGFVLCVLMLVLFLSERQARAVKLTDWPFTSAFLTGCALINLSSLTFLGDNTQALCIVRIWCFHFLFACTISPLLVKVYRIYQLVGSTEHNPSIISSTVAFAMTMPIILIQVAILTIFTIVSPPEPEESIIIVAEGDGGGVTQVVQCQHESPAFYITILLYEFALVLTGCALALRARKVELGFLQSTELLFSMFNIGFIGVGIAVISVAMNVDQQAQIVLFTMGVFWGTVYSSAAFVVPRLLEARQDTQQRRSTATTSAAAAAAALPTPAAAAVLPTPTPPPAAAQDLQSQALSEMEQRRHPPAPAISQESDDDDDGSSGFNRGYLPSGRLSDNEITGWSAVQNDDDLALGTRSTTSQI